jgi:hypothetical protein
VHRSARRWAWASARADAIGRSQASAAPLPLMSTCSRDCALPSPKPDGESEPSPTWQPFRTPGPNVAPIQPTAHPGGVEFGPGIRIPTTVYRCSDCGAATDEPAPAKGLKGARATLPR